MEGGWGAEEIMYQPWPSPSSVASWPQHNLSCPDWNRLSGHTLAHIQRQPPPAGNGCLKELPTGHPQPYPGVTCLRWLSRSSMLVQRMADPGLQLEHPPALAHGGRVQGMSGLRLGTGQPGPYLSKTGQLRKERSLSSALGSQRQSWQTLITPGGL